MIMVKEQVPLVFSLILSFAAILEQPALLLLVNYKRKALLSMKRKPNYFCQLLRPTGLYIFYQQAVKHQSPVASCCGVCVWTWNLMESQFQHIF